jgi:hypothetical protein
VTEQAYGRDVTGSRPLIALLTAAAAVALTPATAPAS